MKLSDYVVQYLVDLGIRHVFCISGHGNLHLIDSLGKHPQIQYIATQHEQAAATAAEAYAKITDGIGAAIVTTGPGGTNTVTGVAGAWLDSVPVIYISGQVNLEESIRNTKVRTFGVQEINIVDIVRPITKYAIIVVDPAMIKYHLQEAVYQATSGRPGPVWLDIPLNVSHAEIDPETLPEFHPPVVEFDRSGLRQRIQTITKLLAAAKRPVILAGAGIKRAHARREFAELVERLKFPVLTTYSGADLIAHDHSLSFGRPGINGMRSANFVIQNADLLLAIGSRIPPMITSSRPNTFARGAKKIIVDADSAELNKNWIKGDVLVQSDAKIFLAELLEAIAQFRGTDLGEWVKKCQEWKERYSAVRPEYWDRKDGVNSFVFLDALSDELTSDDIYVHDMGSAFSCSMQSFKIKPGQYVSSNYGLANMGYSLPAAIGSWFGRKYRKRVVLVSGDGGMQMSIGELQTIAHYKIPIKIFILNNHCYLTIKHSQEMYFGGRFVDSTPESGYEAPDFSRIAEAYGLASAKISNQLELRGQIRKILETPGPFVCEVEMPEDQLLIPKLQARVVNGKYVQDPLEEMYPYLPPEEFEKNMFINPLKE